MRAALFPRHPAPRRACSGLPDRHVESSPTPGVVGTMPTKDGVPTSPGCKGMNSRPRAVRGAG